MAEAHTFIIHPIGFSEEAIRSLRRVLRVSSGSVRNYELDDTAHIDEQKLFIVNADNNDAISYWCKHYLGEDKTPDVPTVFAGKRSVKGEGLYNINFPFAAAQVISTLDTMTIKELNFIPELTIGRDLDETSLSEAFLESLVSDNEQCGFTALVVDDSKPVRKQLEIELKMMGAQVELSESGESAIQLCQENEYDIIFLDVVMPGMDGYKVCRYLKKYHRSKGTPVIMLTGKSSPFDKVKGTLSGCDSYLTKPLEHEQFQTITRKYIPEMASQ